MNFEEQMAQFERNKQIIMKRTGMSLLRFNTMVFELGMKYLEHEYNGDLQSAQSLAGVQLFWKWWTNVWYQCDEHYLLHAAEFTEAEYARFHVVYVKESKVYPNRFIYDQLHKQSAKV